MNTGKALRSLPDLADGGFYVASAGEPLKRVNYAIEENGVPLSVGSTRNLAVPLRSETRGRRTINDSTGGLLEEENNMQNIEELSIFTPTVY